MWLEMILIIAVCVLGILPVIAVTLARQSRTRPGIRAIPVEATRAGRSI